MYITVAATNSPAQRDAIRPAAMKRSLQPLRHANRRAQAAAVIRDFTSVPTKRSPQFFGDIKDGFNDAVDAVADGADKVADTVTDGFNDAVGAVGDVVDQAGDQIGAIVDSASGAVIDFVNSARTH